MLLKKLFLKVRSKHLLKQGLWVRSEYPEVFEYEGGKRVGTAVMLGKKPALLLGFTPPLFEGEELACDFLQCVGYVGDLPVYRAEGVRGK